MIVWQTDENSSPPPLCILTSGSLFTGGVEKVAHLHNLEKGCVTKAAWLGLQGSGAMLLLSIENAMSALETS